MTTRPFALLVVLSFGMPVLAADQGPAEDVPELKVLANYAGKWDVKFTVNDAPFTTGEVEATWTLDGRFLQQSVSLPHVSGSQPLKMTTLMTYDPDQQKYRFWRFVSNGSVSESSGTWDAKTRTMTSIGKDKDVTATTTAKFSDEGTEEWKIVVRDAGGNDVATITGTNTRKKE